MKLLILKKYLAQARQFMSEMGGDQGNKIVIEINDHTILDVTSLSVIKTLRQNFPNKYLLVLDAEKKYANEMIKSKKEKKEVNFQAFVYISSLLRNALVYFFAFTLLV